MRADDKLRDTHHLTASRPIDGPPSSRLPLRLLDGAERGLDPAQNGPVPDLIASSVEVETVKRVMILHRRQENEWDRALSGELAQDRVIAVDHGDADGFRRFQSGLGGWYRHN